MDTVEWGSGSPSAGPLAEAPDNPSAGRSLARLGGRWTALVIAAAGVAATAASELLPWVTLHLGGTANSGADANTIGLSGDPAVGLDRLNAIGVIAYQLGGLAVLALVGAVLFGRVGQRRSLFGFAIGSIVAQALNLTGLIHSFSQLLNNGLPVSQQSTGFHTTVQPGTYTAAAGLLLLLAATVLAAAPERVRTQLVEAVREPVDAQFTDEPIELTVTQVKPIDEAYYTRPDPHRR